MKSFSEYLQATQEVGYVEQISGASTLVKGLPKVHPGELIIFESGSLGQVSGIDAASVTVLLLSGEELRIGTRATRTNEWLKVPVSFDLLGQTLSPMGVPFDTGVFLKGSFEYRDIDLPPPGINSRKDIDASFETGVVLVDLVAPLGKGQRELVIGDPKMGKRDFLQQVMLNHVNRGGVAIYALVAKRRADVINMQRFIQQRKIADKVVIVASVSTDPTGLVFITPYSAMTIAEFFRDQQQDVLVVLDDLTIHAKYYREIGLTSKRFPGRDSYPSDVFYVHARLLERAGKFQQGSITCLPVADTAMGDITGYIQTNLMSMTDGHIYFDKEIANQGRQPAINPFLSVTRVGHQAQTPLLKALSRRLTQFLVAHEQLVQLIHFGGEISADARDKLQLGNHLIAMLNQTEDSLIPIPVSVVFICAAWSKNLDTYSPNQIQERMRLLGTAYLQNHGGWKTWFDQLLAAHTDPQPLIDQGETIANQLMSQ